MKRTIVVAILLGSLTTFATEQSSITELKLDQVMSPKELKETGVAGLTAPQKLALNAWLNRYTQRVLSLSLQAAADKPAPLVVSSKCSPAIESAIAGEFEGWSGETIFKLDSGQIWQQAEYAYTYSYSYRPDVTIYQTQEGCRMKVEDEEETILVKRIK